MLHRSHQAAIMYECTGDLEVGEIHNKKSVENMQVQWFFNQHQPQIHKRPIICCIFPENNIGKKIENIAVNWIDFRLEQTG